MADQPRNAGGADTSRFSLQHASGKAQNSSARTAFRKTGRRSSCADCAALSLRRSSPLDPTGTPEAATHGEYQMDHRRAVLPAVISPCPESHEAASPSARRIFSASSTQCRRSGSASTEMDQRANSGSARRGDLVAPAKSRPCSAPPAAVFNASACHAVAGCRQRAGCCRSADHPAQRCRTMAQPLAPVSAYD